MAKYIDADKLKNTLKENIYPSNRSGKTFNSLLEFVISLIDDMLTAEQLKEYIRYCQKYCKTEAKDECL